MFRRDHIRLIAVHFLKHSMRGGAGLVFGFFGLVTGLLCAQIVLGSIEMVKSTGVDPSEMIRAGEELLRGYSSLPSDQISYLASTKPAVISAFLVLMFFVTPALGVLGSFNQLSGDIGSKGLRYLVQRTERTNLFFGRLIGAYLQTLIVFLFLFLIVGVYMIATLGMYPAIDVALWMASGYLRLAVLVLPYTALCAWLSAAIDVPFGTLALALLVIIFVPAVASIAGGINPGVGEFLGYLYPGGYKWMLLHPSPVQTLGVIGVMLAFTALFTWLGWRHFERRDL